MTLSEYLKLIVNPDSAYLEVCDTHGDELYSGTIRRFWRDGRDLAQCPVWSVYLPEDTNFTLSVTVVL